MPIEDRQIAGHYQSTPVIKGYVLGTHPIFSDVLPFDTINCRAAIPYHLEMIDCPF